MALTEGSAPDKYTRITKKNLKRELLRLVLEDAPDIIARVWGNVLGIYLHQHDGIINRNYTIRYVNDYGEREVLSISNFHLAVQDIDEGNAYTVVARNKLTYDFLRGIGVSSYQRVNSLTYRWRPFIDLNDLSMPVIFGVVAIAMVVAVIVVLGII